MTTLDDIKKCYAGQIEDEDDFADLCHRYFEDDFDSNSWVDIYEEGVRIHNKVFDDDVEEHSPKSDMYAVVAAASAWGVMNTFARILGVDQKTLFWAIEDWYEGDSKRIFSIGADGLMALIAEAEKDMAEDP